MYAPEASGGAGPGDEAVRRATWWRKSQWTLASRAADTLGKRGGLQGGRRTTRGAFWEAQFPQERTRTGFSEGCGVPGRGAALGNRAAVAGRRRRGHEGVPGAPGPSGPVGLPRTS